MSTLQPRVVLVTRETDYERLLAAYATRQQASFVARRRGRSIDEVEARHHQFRAVLKSVQDAVPRDWRLAKVMRADLDRFLFSPEDIVVAVGQDGLVANLAKYVDGQPVLGVNPAPDVYEGVLARLRWDHLVALLPRTAQGEADIERRTMARVTLDDGQALNALNEVFIGHSSHQSARYTLQAMGKSERQSSSGVIVSTGTGATGWARSIMAATGRTVALSPTTPRLAFFVREPWPSVSTGATLAFGPVDAGRPLVLSSEMDDQGAIFADGMEQDRLTFGWGRVASVGVAPGTLNLVRPG